jgi:hypothetical protein
MTTFKNLKEATQAYNELETRLQNTHNALLVQIQALEARMDLSAKFAKKLDSERKLQAQAILKLRVGK